MGGSEPLGPVDWRRPSTTAHMAGLGLLAVSLGMVVSAVVELGSGGDEAAALLLPGVVGAGLGALLWRTTRVAGELGPAVALSTVAATWAVASAWGALPFVLAGAFDHLDDALFESVSGFTGTGSTVMVPIAGQPRGLLFWRNLTQWFGGMGMVVLAVAVLPFLGVGGLELMKSESPGPTADRLAPRVRETAKRLWLVYAGFTVVTVIVLLIVGMGLFDAVVHAFTTVSTGGFSPYDASIAHFDSVTVEIALIVLMLAGATNFTLHWRALVERRPGVYWTSTMFRFYMGLFVVAAVTVVSLNLADGVGSAEALREGTFMTAAMITSTGFGVDDFSAWVPGAQMVMLFLMMTGGMVGSTSGGMKLFRFRTMLAFAVREARQTRHPRAVLPLRLGATLVPETVLARVAGFVLLYVLIGVASVLVVGALGADMATAVGGVATSLGNGGPGLGEAGTDFLTFSRPARAHLMVLMLVGRLEIFAVLIGLGRLIAAVRGVTSPRRRSVAMR